MKKVAIPNGDISEQAKLILEQEIAEIPDIDFSSSASVQLLRNAVSEQWLGLCQQIPYNYTFDTIKINGINCYQIDPPEISDNGQLIIYIHGGSYLFGHPTQCKNIPVSIAHESGVRVISVEYRLGPECPLPAAIDDVLSVIKGIRNHFGENVRYGLMGHSSGGGLALIATLQAMSKNLPKPSAIALLAPWVDLEFEGDSMSTLKNVDINPPSVEWFYQSVEGFIGQYQRTDPAISPLHQDLSGLCPTYIQQGGRDRLLSDATRLNRQLLNVEVESILDIWEGLWHGFQMMPLLPEAQQANKATAAFFRKSLKRK